ncbi:MULTISPECIES: hypothetical protein [unclassified Psychrobacter]|uniref:hypothetical protein n=1 Tax=unclassified Psychrobacter TaxID=196806 RepID=UPI0018F359FB|nr:MULTISPECIES: hypothetical protein [unclassified Psychrobacter]
MNKAALLSLFTLSLTLVGCATTSSLDKLEKTTPQTVQLPVNYIDAYANAKDYYLRCATKSGVSYPITVYANGTPVTITNTTPDISVSSNLDRKNKLATLSILEGANVSEHTVFSEIDDSKTQVSFYNKTSGYLRSTTYKQKMEMEKFDLLRKASLDHNIKCVK